jgi:hypothetical protein
MLEEISSNGAFQSGEWRVHAGVEVNKGRIRGRKDEDGKIESRHERSAKGTGILSDESNDDPWATVCNDFSPGQCILTATWLKYLRRHLLAGGTF